MNFIHVLFCLYFAIIMRMVTNDEFCSNKEMPEIDCNYLLVQDQKITVNKRILSLVKSTSVIFLIGGRAVTNATPTFFFHSDLFHEVYSCLASEDNQICSFMFKKDSSDSYFFTGDVNQHPARPNSCSSIWKCHLPLDPLSETSVCIKCRREADVKEHTCCEQPDSCVFIRPKDTKYTTVRTIWVFNRGSSEECGTHVLDTVFKPERCEASCGGINVTICDDTCNVELTTTAAPPAKGDNERSDEGFLKEEEVLSVAIVVIIVLCIVMVLCLVCCVCRYNRKKKREQEEKGSISSDGQWYRPTFLRAKRGESIAGGTETDASFIRTLHELEDDVYDDDDLDSVSDLDLARRGKIVTVKQAVESVLSMASIYNKPTRPNTAPQQRGVQQNVPQTREPLHTGPQGKVPQQAVPQPGAPKPPVPPPMVPKPAVPPPSVPKPAVPQPSAPKPPVPPPMVPKPAVPPPSVPQQRIPQTKGPQQTGPQGGVQTGSQKRESRQNDMRKSGGPQQYGSAKKASLQDPRKSQPKKLSAYSDDSYDGSSGSWSSGSGSSSDSK